MKSLIEILAYFQKGKTPTSEQFKDSWTSFWHKSEKIEQTAILGLQDALNSKADRDDLINLGVGIKGYGDDVLNIADLLNVPDKYEGLAVAVISDKDVQGNSFIWLYNGTTWNRTPYTTLPKDVLKTTDIIGVEGESEDKVVNQKAWTERNNTVNERIDLADGMHLVTFTDSNENVVGTVGRNGIWDVLVRGVDTDKLASLYKLDLNELARIMNVSSYSTIKDTPYMFAHVDANDNIIECVKSNGVKYIESLSAGNLSNNQAGDDSDFTPESLIMLNLPTIARIDLSGSLPTDVSATRTPTTMELTLKINGSTSVKCYAKVAIQGDTSAHYPKKGYAIDLLNKYGSKLTLKFGDWYESDGWHLKSYYTDETLTRDVSGGRLWNEMRKERTFKAAYISPLIDGMTSNIERYGAYAKFYIEGFPVEIYSNGEFIGAYIWRMKKNRNNYRLDKSNKKHIQLEARGLAQLDQFEITKWELRNPSVKGYVEGGPVTDPEVLAPINTFFDWVGDCVAGRQNFKATHAQHIDLLHEIDYFLLTELIFNFDGIEKNYLLTSWDGVIFKTLAQDLDLTAGYYRVINNTQFVYNTTGRTNHLMNLLMDNYLDAIKNRYTELVNKGVFSIEKIMSIYLEIPSVLGADLLAKNFDKWGSYSYENYGGLRYDSYRIYSYFSKRLAFLNTKFLN